MQKRVNLVDLVKSFQTSILSMSLLLNLIFEQDSYSNEYLVTICNYLLENFSFDTAESEPLEVCKKLAKS